MTETQPLITVLLPCYNAMPFLPEALDSIINQTYSNLEILCINDGSTDDTASVLEAYAANDPRIRVIHNETNLRLIRTLNKGIDLASGEYIARMDADDISMPTRIEMELNFMLENPEIDIVGCGVINIDESGVRLSKKIVRQRHCKANLFASFFYVPIGHPELLIKTSVLKMNQFLYEDHVLHSEDYELWARLLRLGYNLHNMSDYLLYFRINSQSVSRKYTSIQDKNFVECARKHIEAYSGRLIDTEVMQVVVNRIPKNLAPDIIRRGIKKFKWIRKDFLSKETLNKTERKEIYTVYKSHLFDICVQVMKRTSLRNKLFAFWLLFLNIDMLFNQNVRNYIRSKF